MCRRVTTHEIVAQISLWNHACGKCPLFMTLGSRKLSWLRTNPEDISKCFRVSRGGYFSTYFAYTKGTKGINYGHTDVEGCLDHYHQHFYFLSQPLACGEPTLIWRYIWREKFLPFKQSSHIRSSEVGVAGENPWLWMTYEWRGAIKIRLYLEHTYVWILISKFEIRMPILEVGNVH